MKDSIPRFDGVERAVHWTTAALMLACMATAAVLKVPTLQLAVGHRLVVRYIHVVTGYALPLPLLVSLALWKRSGALRLDLGRLNRWSASDRRWLRTWGTDRALRPGKFNAGQKLNSAIVGGVILVTAMTGTVMFSYSAFPLPWRTGATFVHDLVAFAFLFLLAGHVAYALANRASLVSMVRGHVDRGWAIRHAPAWVEEVDACDTDAPGGDPPPSPVRPPPAVLPR